MIFENNNEYFPQEEPIANVETKEITPQSIQMAAPEELLKNKPVPRVSKKIKKVAKNAQRKQNTPKTFYEKNICRNIARKVIRMIESGIYKEELLRFCGGDKELYNDFDRTMVSNIEMITGPTALKEFLKVEDNISQVFKRFTGWYLR